MKNFATKLLVKKIIAKDTTFFSFEKPKGFDFIAGQWIKITLPDIKQPGETGERIMSLCSSPSDSELSVTMRRGRSIFKNKLHSLPMGAELIISQAVGHLTIHDDATRPAIFIAGGVGITPFRSMTRDQEQKNFTHDIYLFDANQNASAAPFLKEFQSIKNEKFHYTPVLAEEDVANSERGFVTAEILKKHIPAPCSNNMYYIVGPSPMILAMKKILAEMAVDNKNIKTELFG